jgi:hypothetical protein
MSIKSDVLALFFGALLIFVAFGDDHLGKIAGVAVGNLDTIFGIKLWPIFDVIYPVATVVVFLLYGWAKGNRLRINYSNSLLFISFLAALVLMNFDDVAIALNLAVYPPTVYWVAISWIYPVYGAAAFFLFGKLHEEPSA